jgi:hypothetical protein
MASETSPSGRERAPLVTDAIPPALQQRGATQRQVLGICLLGALALACFASRDTPGWAERLGDSALDHWVRNIAGAWDEAMETFGLTDPHEALRDAMRRALDQQWGE